MSEGSGTAPARGEILVVHPGDATAAAASGGSSYWQPVPANGFIDVLVAPDRVAMEHPLGLGTQTVPPGSYVREHSHDRNEEVLYFLRGRGRAVLDGGEKEVALQPGVAIFVGRNRRHMFINDGDEDLQFLWLIVPNGLETFFREIGRVRAAGEPVPAPFPRPDNVLEIERRTVFAPPPADPRLP